jgi:hypothetical protein
MKSKEYDIGHEKNILIHCALFAFSVAQQEF